MEDTAKLYLVTRMNDNYEVEVCGIFTSRDKAENVIKEDIFNFTYQSGFDSYNTQGIPEFEYTIYQIADIDKELL